MKNNKNKIKVCLVSSSSLTMRFFLLRDIQFLKQQGYEVSGLCSEGKWVKEIRNMGVELKTITIKRKITPFSDLITLFNLFLYFRKQKFDIVNTYTPKAALLGQLAARLAGVPIIVNTIYGFYFTEHTPFWKRKFFTFVERFVALFSSLIFFGNKEDMERAVREKIAPASKIKFLSNGINLKRFNPQRFSREFIERKKQSLGINPEVKVVGIVARLIREKGYLILFKAFKEIVKKFPDTLLLVVGPQDPEKKDFLDLSILKDYGIENNVKFLGGRRDIDEIYPLMDIFVLPSFREGLPTSVLEASAMARPVVVTDIRGCREAVEDKKTGFLVPMRDSERLAESISYLLGDPEKAQEMGERGWEKVRREFNEEQILERIKREYQRLIEEKLYRERKQKITPPPLFSRKKWWGVKVCQTASVDLTIRFLLLRQILFLKKQSFDISVVCSKGSCFEEIRNQGINFKAVKIKRKIISPFSDLKTLFKLIFYFEKEKFDIIHTHSPKAGLLGQVAAKIAGVPIVINTIHGYYFNENTGFFKRKFFIWVERISGLFSDLIFFQSREDIETCQKEKISNLQKIRFLGNGINLKTFNPQRFSQEFIEKKKTNLGLNPQMKIIGMVGRLVKEKGYLELFEAFKKVLEKFPQTLLLIVGPLDPEKRDCLKPEIVKKYGIGERVKFLGLRRDIEEIYPLMDIFVLPSWREGFPRSILEASAMAKPVVATNIRGCREAVDDNETGILIAVKNPEKLTEAIIELLENPDKAEEMGQRGRKKTKKEFDENLVFDRINKEYQRLIRKKL